MSLTIMRRIKFCAGHRLFKHGGKCEHFHGHNYVADFFVTGDTQDTVGRVMDFADLKSKCKGWLDENWDHSFLVLDQDDNAIEALRMVKPSRLFLMPYNPTAENMARYLLEEVCPKILEDTGATATRVRIWETDESYAEACIDERTGLVMSSYDADSSDR
ncbi:MAG: 6-pyruvoyl trahydropterin synthase family protein [Pirellula sp.]|jgi:6-pyruvoyltetrahydropterin/6-carboxytetrahydropterin synthase|nr:6-carboxytetrahydropterin synthase [Pirellula sp.]